jgi:MinD superfamily P-loop ATPase
MIIAVASGKGGTGKTTVAVNLARALDQEVLLLDCDVEEPNAGLFLRGQFCEQTDVTLPVPEVDETRCDGCGECSRLCQFGAIVSFGTKALTFPELCHGCGGCSKVCPRQAIGEVGHRLGQVATMHSGMITLIEGRLDVGVPMAPPVVQAVKRHLSRRAPGQVAILDAPPGTSCPVITTLHDVDAVLLVTEPTPFGLHDLSLAVEMVRALQRPFGVVLNRVGVGDDRVERFCRRERIPILLEIPDDRRIAQAYSRGELVVEVLPEFRDLLNCLMTRTRALARGTPSSAEAAPWMGTKPIS